MITTQRLLIILIALNLLIGTIVSVWNDPTIIDFDTIDQQTQRELDDEQIASSDAGTIDAVRQYAGKLYEATIGNAITWGRIIIRVFLGGLEPLAVSEDSFNSNIEKMVIKIINWFRAIIAFLMIYEAYLVFKNRKTS